MYACGLVLWELVSRCSATIPINTNVNSSIPNSLNLNTHSTLNANPGGVGNSVSQSYGGVNEYKLPFEAEVSNPTLEQMQVRPIFVLTLQIFVQSHKLIYYYTCIK